MKIDIHDRRRTSHQPMIHSSDFLFYTSTVSRALVASAWGSGADRHICFASIDLMYSPSLNL
jgi:hypothetical protein